MGLSVEDLEKQADQLPRPSAATVKEFGTKSERMAALVTEKMLARSDILVLIGSHRSDDSHNLSMARDNHQNHARFMQSLFEHFDASVFVETIQWVFRTYRARSFHIHYWSALFNTWMDVLQSEMSENSYSEIAPFYSWMITRIPAFEELTGGPETDQDFDQGSSF